MRFQPWVLEEEKALPLLEYAWKNGINTWDTVGITFLYFTYRLLRDNPPKSWEYIYHLGLSSSSNLISGGYLIQSS